MDDAPRLLPLGLLDFLGTWTVSRVIDDRMANRTGRFEGRAVIAGTGSAAVYDEAGQLDPGTGAAFEAARRYLWAEEAQAILIRFDDGRLFHRLHLGAARAEAQHDCAPDIYRVAYDFTLWPQWSAVWTVTGPRKNYVMTTRYTRAAQ